MSAAQSKSSEPSMEEILASIRKIISDDTGAKPAAAPVVAANPLPPVVAPAPVPAPAPVAAIVEEDEDVMDLMPMPAAKPVASHVIAAPKMEALGQDDIDLQFQAPARHAPAPTPAPAPVLRQATDFEALMAKAEFSPTPAAPTENLMSSNTDRVVSTAFSSLATTVLNNNGRTLDSVVEDMMRPMIKGWLDDNLPGIVERLIKAEIERVARGGR